MEQHWSRQGLTPDSALLNVLQDMPLKAADDPSGNFQAALVRGRHDDPDQPLADESLDRVLLEDAPAPAARRASVTTLVATSQEKYFDCATACIVACLSPFILTCAASHKRSFAARIRVPISATRLWTWMSCEMGVSEGLTWFRLT